MWEDLKNNADKRENLVDMFLCKLQQNMHAKYLIPLSGFFNMGVVRILLFSNFGRGIMF
jgi:hypothetical protein